MTARVCYDWSPLHYHEDPIPGDPDRVEAASKSYAATSDTILQVSDYLAKLDADGQQSEAITALKARSRELSGQLQSVSSRYTETAAALRCYAPELRGAQAMADAAIAAGGPAEARRKSASSDAANIWVGWKTTLEPSQAKDFEDSYFLAKHQADSAAADVATARAQIEDAIRKRDAAAETAKGMISAAITNSPITDTVLDQFKEVWDAGVDAIKGVGKWVWDNIDNISLALTIAAAVVVFIPGLDVLAPVLLAASRVATMISWAKKGVELGRAAVKWNRTGDSSDFVSESVSIAAGLVIGKVAGGGAASIAGKAVHSSNQAVSKRLWDTVDSAVTSVNVGGETQMVVSRGAIGTTLQQISKSTIDGETKRLIQGSTKKVADAVSDRLSSDLAKSEISDAQGAYRVQSCGSDGR